MPIQPTVRRLLSWAICLCAGCTLSHNAKKSADTIGGPQNAAAGAQTSSAAAGNAAPPPVSNASANPRGISAADLSAGKAATTAPDPRVLDDVLNELAQLGSVQPEAQARLIDDLRKTDPAYWPMLVQTFRASLEYRRRSVQKSAEASTTTGETPGATALPDTALAASEAPSKGAAEAPSVDRAESPAPAKTAPTTMAAAPPASPPTGAPIDAKPRPPTNVATESSTAKPSPAAPDWRRHLDQAIADLERQMHDRPGEADALANQVYLRLLDVAAGRRDEALKPIAGLPPGQQDYWNKQLFALCTYLDQRAGDPGRRAAEASLHLSKAAASLGEQGPLVLRNLAFCTDVHSYGVFKRFEPGEFRAGQKILLYAEVENFKSEETAQGFHTSLEASYQILDRQGQRVSHDELSLTEEHCQNRRRDFFVRYFIDLPKNIYEGSYTLELTIEDKLGRKIGQSTIDFLVKPK